MIMKNSKELILRGIKSHYGFKKDADFARFLGIKPQTLNSWYKRNTFDHELLYAKCLEISPDWLITGKGDMLKPKQQEVAKRNLIPLYSDVSTIGGRNMLSSSDTNTVEWIDAGDWFPNADSAIRHYGDSMREYPSGCILGLKSLKDLQYGFILGQNHVVEYGEDYNCVTKRVQKDKNQFMAYSTNIEVYPDGQLIHQPFPLIDIHRAWRVLGYVVQTESSTGVINVQVKVR